MKSRWQHPKQGARRGQLATITISVEVSTGRADSMEVLAHALAGDVIDALTKKHEVSAKIRQTSIDGDILL